MLIWFSLYKTGKLLVEWNANETPRLLERGYNFLFILFIPSIRVLAGNIKSRQSLGKGKNKPFNCLIDSLAVV
jgi:hypothetical protein